MKGIHARAEAASASKAAGSLGCGSLVRPRPHLAPESSWDSSHEFSKWSQAPYLCSMSGRTVSSCRSLQDGLSPPACHYEMDCLLLPVTTRWTVFSCWSLQDRFLNSLPSETAEHCFLTQTNLHHFILERKQRQTKVTAMPSFLCQLDPSWNHLGKESQ